MSQVRTGRGRPAVTTVPALTSNQVSDVVAAAKRAWELHGERVALRETSVNSRVRLTLLEAPISRHVEYVVECNDPDVWKMLAAKASGEWQLCALVPLALMGIAHERLSGRGFRLQGWWLQDGSVAFGGIEVA